MKNANPVSVPADKTILDLPTNEQMKEDSEAPYAEAVGSLMYLAIGTRPDIAYVINTLSQHLKNPKKIHWNNLKRVLKYIKGTQDYGLLYTTDNDMKLKIYSDADYGGDKETRKSRSGYLTALGSATVAWKSRKQKLITSSTTESEFVAANQATTQIIWADRMWKELQIHERKNKPTLCLDSQTAIALIKNPAYHFETKHIDIKYKVIRQRWELKQFIVDYVRSKKQLADILTKPLPRNNFEKQREAIKVIKV